MKIQMNGMILIFLLLAVFCLPSFSRAAPNLMNYEGILTDTGGSPANGDFPMTFRIFDTATGGSPLYEETQTVTVANGIYNILLGSGTPTVGTFDPALFSGDNRWLEVVVGGEILTPRQRITSVAYALQAHTATAVFTGAITSDSIAPGAITVDKLGITCASGEVLMQIAGTWQCTTLSGVPNCNPGDFINCYTGPTGTLSVGPCAAGTRTCNTAGSGFGGCMGEVLPATEVCDGLDEDCNGLVDDAAGSPTWYADVDGDGYGDPGNSRIACSQPTGFVADNTDCDDGDAASHPGGFESCDGVDNDCDGTVDNGCMVPPACTPAEQNTLLVCGPDPNCVQAGVSPTCFNAYIVLLNCTAAAGCTDQACMIANCPNEYTAVFVSRPPECAAGDTRSCGSNVGACQTGTESCDFGLWSGVCAGEIAPVPEVCGDGIDNDCNGVVDDSVSWYRDNDLDLFGDPSQMVTACQQPAGYVGNPDDCDDSNMNINPSAAEVCDGIDNNCDGTIDEYFNLGVSCTVGLGACQATGTYVCLPDGSDSQCNAVPGSPSTEICDGIDNNCDGAVDEGLGLGSPCGIGQCAGGATECDPGGGTVCSTEPGGSNNQSFPELCDGLDNDCDGLYDEDFPTLGQLCDGPDSDLCAYGSMECSPDGTTTVCGPETVTNIVEVCNGLDDDCDGFVDEGNPGGGSACTTGQQGVCSAGMLNCTGGGLLCESIEVPTAEICDGLDNNCNGIVDEACAAQGEPCTQDLECTTGHCTDGVCCNAGCNGTCETCSGIGTSATVGVCGFIQDGVDPDNECTGTTTCTGSGVCWAKGSGVSCSNNYECLSNNCLLGACQ